MKKTALITAGILTALTALLLIRGALFASRQVEPGKMPNLAIDSAAAAQHLAGALRLKTISYSDEKLFDRQAFAALRHYLKKTWPAAHGKLKKEIINEMTLLYKWEGKNKNKKPILLMAHQDVVPVERGTEGDWTYPAYSGKIADGYIWGRGAMDIKNSLVAIMESVEYLVRQGFQPEQTIYLAFGHDEEVGGRRGNQAVAALLKKRGIRLRAVLDEGGSLVYNMVPGVSRPAALVGISEKGYVSLELTVNDPGGHSAMPPKHTAVGKLATAIHLLEREPFDANFSGPARSMFTWLGSDLPFGYRVLFGNTWLFKPLIEMVFSGRPATSAMIRTTTAATMIEGSQKENVLPQSAKATINFRIMPGESVQSTIDHVREVIDNPEISIKPLKTQNEPSPVSDPESPEFAMLQRTISTLFPEALVAPYLVTGGTDSRYYTTVSDQVFRFCPTRIMSKKDLSRMHGTDERISVKNFSESIKFFILYIQGMNSL